VRLAIRFAAMGDPQDDGLRGGIIDLIENAVVAKADPPAILLAAQPHGAHWARLDFEGEQGLVGSAAKIRGKVAAFPSAEGRRRMV